MVEKNSIEEMFEEHIKQEPKEYDVYFKEVDRGIESSEHIRWRLKKERLEKVKNLSNELRNKIFSKFKQGGISIKEVADYFQVNSEAVGALIYYNIKNTTALREESI